MRAFLVYLLGLLLFASNAQAQQEWIRLSASGKYLNLERGVLGLARVKPRAHSSMWEVLKVDNQFFVLRNRLNGQYLISSGDTLSTTDQQPSPQAAGPHFWRYFQDGDASYLEAQSRTGSFQIIPGSQKERLKVEAAVEPEAARQPATVDYRRVLSSKQAPLHVEKGAPVFGTTDEGSPACMWEVKELSGRDGLNLMFINRKSGEVLSSSGNTLTTQPQGPVNTGQEPFVWRAVRTGELYEMTNSQGARLTGISLPQVR